MELAHKGQQQISTGQLYNISNYFFMGAAFVEIVSLNHIHSQTQLWGHGVLGFSASVGVY